MKTMKKIVALVLVCVMALGTLPAAFAAFTYADAEAITAKYVDAVDFIYQLNIMQGDAKGNFNPQKNLKRSELAKTVFVLNNGGSTNANFFASAEDAPFQDVPKNLWYAGYVNWSSSRGFIDGTSPTTYRPEGTLTAAQTCKVLLISLGYSNTIENYTGNGWALRVMGDAMASGLLEGLEDITDYNAPINREQFAQLIYNACNANVVGYKDGVLTTQDDSLVMKKYGLKTAKGVLLANDVVALNGDKADAGKCRIAGITDLFPVAAPLELLGREVKILYKETAGKPSKVYGAVAASGADKVIEVTIGDLPKEDDGGSPAADVLPSVITVAKKDYTINDGVAGVADTAYYSNFGVAAGASNTDKYYDIQGNLATSNKVRLIVDDKNNITYIFAEDITFGKISVAKDGKVTLTPFKAGTYGATTLASIETKNILDGAALAVKDTLCFGYKIASTDKYVLRAMNEPLEGTITRVSGGTATIAGKGYTMGAFKGADNTATLLDDNQGSAKTFYVYGSKILGVKNPNEGAKSTYALVLASRMVKDSVYGTSYSAYVWAVLQGETAPKEYKLASYKLGNDTYTKDTFVVGAANDVYSTDPMVKLSSSAGTINTSNLQVLCSYSLNSDGTAIDLTEVVALSGAAAGSHNTFAGGRVNGNRLNADSVTFILWKDTYVSYVGNAIPNYKAAVASVVDVVDNYVTVAFVKTNEAGVAGKSSRAILLKDAYTQTIAGKNYVVYETVIGGVQATYISETVPSAAVRKTYVKGNMMVVNAYENKKFDGDDTTYRLMSDYVAPTAPKMLSAAGTNEYIAGYWQDSSDQYVMDLKQGATTLSLDMDADAVIYVVTEDDDGNISVEKATPAEMTDSPKADGYDIVVIRKETSTSGVFGDVLEAYFYVGGWK